MSKSLIDEIYEIAKNADNSDRLVLFTNTFKAVGHLVMNDSVEGVLTLRDVMVCNSLENFECAFSHHTYDWFNVVESKIVAFSVTKTI